MDEPDSTVVVRYGMDDSHWTWIRLAEERNFFAEGFGYDREAEGVYYTAEQGDRHNISPAKHPESFRGLR
ncbi:MAG: hypothetical protein OTJ97_07380 [SAR202 cluster bacterium]|nr:hypothetical protein [SAR202 cluster bacterium]